MSGVTMSGPSTLENRSSDTVDVRVVLGEVADVALDLEQAALDPACAAAPCAR